MNIDNGSCLPLDIIHFHLPRFLRNYLPVLSPLLSLDFSVVLFQQFCVCECSVVHSFFIPSSLHIQPPIASWIVISIQCPLPLQNYSVPCVIPNIAHLFYTYHIVLNTLLLKSVRRYIYTYPKK